MAYLASFMLLLALQNPAAAHIDQEELFCQATAVYHEARGEPILGQVAVAYVVQNRAGDAAFPSSECAVVYQHKQFTDVQDARPDYSSQAWRDAVQAAAFARLGYVDNPAAGALWYYNPKKTTWKYWKGIKVQQRIGNHLFLGRQ